MIFHSEETGAMGKAVDVVHLDFILPLSQSPLLFLPPTGEIQTG